LELSQINSNEQSFHHFVNISMAGVAFSRGSSRLWFLKFQTSLNMLHSHHKCQLLLLLFVMFVITIIIRQLYISWYLHASYLSLKVLWRTHAI